MVWMNPYLLVLRELSISKLSGCFFDFLPLNLLLVLSHEAKIIIIKQLI